MLSYETEKEGEFRRISERLRGIGHKENTSEGKRVHIRALLNFPFEDSTYPAISDTFDDELEATIRFVDDYSLLDDSSEMSFTEIREAYTLALITIRELRESFPEVPYNQLADYFELHF